MDSDGLGEIKTQFEFDLFSVNPDPGDTGFHLRHFWGELGPFLAGQTNTVFMDGSVSPIALEYWGPSGIAALRNVQFRWAAMRGKNELFIALERPGATADNGRVESRVELQNIKDHFPAPDLTVHYKRSGDWGHVQLAGVLRYIGWVDTVPDEFDLTGHATGWGLNLSTNIKVGPKGTIRAAVVYGEGIENYMTDAPTDIGAAINPSGNPRRPVVGEPLPVLGITAFYDFYWSECFSSAIGYSWWTSTTATCSCRSRSTRANTRSPTCSITPSRTSWRASSFSGAGGPTSRTVSASTTTGSSSRPDTALASTWDGGRSERSGRGGPTVQKERSHRLAQRGAGPARARMS